MVNRESVFGILLDLFIFSRQRPCAMKKVSENLEVGYNYSSCTNKHNFSSVCPEMLEEDTNNYFY